MHQCVHAVFVFGLGQCSIFSPFFFSSFFVRFVLALLLLLFAFVFSFLPCCSTDVERSDTLSVCVRTTLSRLCVKGRDFSCLSCLFCLLCLLCLSCLSTLNCNPILVFRKKIYAWQGLCTFASQRSWSSGTTYLSDHTGTCALSRRSDQPRLLR